MRQTSVERPIDGWGVWDAVDVLEQLESVWCDILSAPGVLAIPGLTVWPSRAHLPHQASREDQGW